MVEWKRSGRGREKGYRVTVGFVPSVMAGLVPGKFPVLAVLARALPLQPTMNPWPDGN